MKKLLMLLFGMLILATTALAQVGIGTTTPNASAMLDVTSTDKGLLIPRVTQAQMLAIPSPASGLMVFNTTAKTLYAYNGGSWVMVTASSAGSLKDTDGDTKIEVEKSADEDIIRFTLAGSEKMTLTGNRLEFPKGANPNIFIGGQSGKALTTGYNNTSIGDSTLKANTTGYNNTATGYQALNLNTTGYNNSAFGTSSLGWNKKGSFNAAFGNLALSSNDSGSYNTAIGSSALSLNVKGVKNVAVGSRALSGSTASGNTAVGHEALISNTTGYSNVAIGVAALTENTTRSHLIAIGDSALFNNGIGASDAKQAQNNLAVGSKALYANTLGWSNTAIGNNALYANTTGSSNVAIGNNSLRNNAVPENVIAIGDSALFNNGIGASETNHGDRNIAIGSKALQGNKKGYDNIAIGYQALLNNSDQYATYNIAIGSQACRQNVSGEFNIAIGYRALFYNRVENSNVAIGAFAMEKIDSSGSFHNYLNTAIGFQALRGSTTISNNMCHSNTALGSNVLYANSSGNRNTGIGASSLQDNETGNDNTGVGYYAMNGNKTGVGNTAVGYGAGSNNTAGDYNTAIGWGTGPNVNNLSNTGAFGRGATTTASNQYRFGNSSVTSIGGYQDWTNISDGRFKTDVIENVAGLDFILKLRPVTYKLDVMKINNMLGMRTPEDDPSVYEKASMVQTGFIAQEVEQAARSVGFNFSGVDAPKNESDQYGLRYSEFVVPLVKAVQEQQAVIDGLLKRIEELEKQVKGKKLNIEH